VISLFLPSLHGGGAERMMLNLARGLAKRGMATDLVLSQATGPYRDQTPSEVRLIDLGAKRALSSLPGLVRYLRVQRPSALLSTLPHGNVVTVWAKRLAGIPTRVVVREGNRISRLTDGDTLRLRVRVLPLLVRHFYPWADAIVAVSQGLAEDLALTAGLPPERIQVIYNPVVTAELLEQASQPLRHPWFGRENRPVILGAGRLTKQKDFYTLVRAFALVRRQRPARLMILGEGEERSSLNGLVRHLGLAEDVALPGFVDNPYSYMAAAAVFALSSAWEGLPNVLIEAMATGTPVVSTDCESGPAEILAEGRYGQLVPVGDVQALAAAILTTLSCPTAVQTLRSRAQDFSADRIVQQYLDILLPST
jgi:glycosyltransferase involved in cell wall biosynthesis